ncbi:MAG: hypothetical protein H7123_02945, partial [Thermoleophilia bacterium]|nr:hypothetical protein [Thermoleophilia bacterium]
MIAAVESTPTVVSSGLQASMLIFAAIAATGVLWRFLTRPRLHFTGTAMLLVGWLGLGVTIAPHALLDRPAVLGVAIV